MTRFIFFFILFGLALSNSTKVVTFNSTQFLVIQNYHCYPSCLICECAYVCLICYVSGFSVIGLVSFASVVSLLSVFGILSISLTIPLICAIYILSRVYRRRRRGRGNARGSAPSPFHPLSAELSFSPPICKALHSP